MELYIAKPVTTGIMNQELRIKKRSKIKTIIHNSLFLIRKPEGFTLIELLIVFSISSILSVLGITSFISYNKTQTLNNATSDLVTMLNVGRSRATSQVKSSSCTGTLNGYKLNICKSPFSECVPPESTNSDYALYAVCDESIVSPAIDSKKLPSGVNFGVSTPKSTFFKVISGGVEGSGTISLALSGYNEGKYIEVGNIGSITVTTGTPPITPTPPPDTTPTPTPTLTVTPPPGATSTPTPTPTSSPTPTPTVTPTSTPTPTPSPSPTPTPTPTPITKRVFATSTTYNGNLKGSSANGLAGADAKCQTLGPAGATWKAWVSSATVNAKDRITDSKYVKVTDSNVVVANSLSDLTDGSIGPIGTGINWNENGNTISTGRVWTGTGTDGTKTISQNHCIGWTYSSTYSGYYGLIGSTNNAWTISSYVNCSNSYRLYCFEQ